MKTVIFSLCVLASLTFSSYARIGETLEQCTQRYGKPVKTERDGSITFSKSGYLIHIDFYQGKAESIEFDKPDDTSDTGKPFSDDEIRLLLDLGSNGAHWKLSSKNNDFILWNSEDGSLNAGYTVSSHYLTIQTTESVKRDTAEREAQEKSDLQKKLNLNGF